MMKSSVVFKLAWTYLVFFTTPAVDYSRVIWTLFYQFYQISMSKKSNLFVKYDKWSQQFRNVTFAGLKVVPATFLLVCFKGLNESTCQIKKNVFYLTSKPLFILENIKFQNSTFSNFMTSSNTNKKYISLNNLESKHSLLMRFGQFMSHYKRKSFTNSAKTATWKLVSGPFVFAKN